MSDATQIPAQAVMDALAEQRNAAMNDAAKATAGLRCALEENARLARELDEAKARIAAIEEAGAAT